MTESFELAEEFLGKKVTIKIDRPLGSKHPKRGYIYPVNYGYVPGVIAPDGEELDAYYLGVDFPLDEAEGICIAVSHRPNDDDDKLIVVPEGTSFTAEEIRGRVMFQEPKFDPDFYIFVNA